MTRAALLPLLLPLFLPACTRFQDAHQVTVHAVTPASEQPQGTTFWEFLGKLPEAPGNLVWGILGAQAFETAGNVRGHRVVCPVPKEGTLAITTTLSADRSVETKIETRKGDPRGP